jgi:putative flippase GtrA
MRTKRMLTASTVATAVDVAVLFALVTGFTLRPGPAAICGCLAGGIVSFLMCRNYVFERPRGSWLGQLVAYITLVVVGGALLSGGIVQLATSSFGAPVLVAKAIAAAIVMLGWNWPVSARVFFPEQRNLPARVGTAGGAS